MVFRNEEEFENLRNFILETYHTDIESPNESIKPLVQSCLNFLMSLDIWKDRTYKTYLLSEEMHHLLKECISSVLYLISLSSIQMKLPFLMMFQRLIDLIQCFFIRSPNTNCDYKTDNTSKSIPFSLDLSHYKQILNEENDLLLLDFQKELFSHFENLKQSLAPQLNFDKVHYFSNEQWMEFSKIHYFDSCYLTDYIELLSAVFNTQIILLDFDFYMTKIPEQEKRSIRHAMNTPFKFKKKIIAIFSEI